MDQGQCLMWTKRKFSMSSNIFHASKNSACDDYSWEEQAFAKDAAASAAGCIWPPRSYSCSFCRREFRSAQALGGHMNVHRRDRARLKQPSSPQNEETVTHPLHQNHVQNNYPFTSLGNYFYSSSICGFASNNNTNPSYNHAGVHASPPDVLPVINKNLREETMIPFFNSPSVPYSSKPNPILGEEDSRLLYSHDGLLDPESDAEKITSNGMDSSSGCIRSERDSDEKSDVAMMSLNLFVHRAHHTPVEFETEEVDTCLKKRKKDASSFIPLFPKSGSLDEHHVQSQVFKFTQSFVEELDLELRLGYCRSQV